MPDLLSAPKAAFLPANIDACAMYRMFFPHMHIPQSLFLFRMDRLVLKDIQGFDVVVVQRQVTESNYKALQYLKEAGKKIIYDLDDDMWNLPSYNPAHKLFKAMEEGFGKCAREADVITVSTVGLRTAVITALPHLKQRILVVPNGVDFNMFRPSRFVKDDGRVILGWQGSNTHGHDLQEVWTILPELMKEFDNLYMEFVGEMAPKELQGHPRVKQRAWVPVGEFAGRFSAWSWDLSLAPLEENRFNRSKSAIKALESAAVGIPCLMSNVRPYAEYCALGGKEMEWLLCNTRREWQSKLRELIADKTKRDHYAAIMKTVAVEHFNMEKTKDNWIHALREAAGWN